MTLPDERYRAVKWAREFLTDLMDTRATQVPQEIRDRARACLRHYPSEWDMQQAAEETPHVFAEQMEPVYRMFKQYEQSKNDTPKND
jgi:hypothetical protein